MAEKNATLTLDVEAAAALGQLVYSTLITQLVSSAGSVAQVSGSMGGAATEYENVSAVDGVEAMRATVAKSISDAQANGQAHALQAQAERERRNAYADSAMGIAILNAAGGGDLDKAKALVEAAQNVKS